MQPRRHGFTLIELLITLVLVGILATIAISFLWSTKDRAYTATVKSDLRSLATYQEMYQAKNLIYAANVTDLPSFQPSPGVTVTITSASAGGWAATGTHVSMAGQCGIFVGDALASDAAPATVAGTVACQ